MIIREHYLSQIRSFYESDLIKIITGIRRCGKSVILKQALSELEAAGKKCLFLDFDLRPVRAKIPNADALIAVGNVAAAAKCYETMVVINPTDASAVLKYGMSLRRLGKKEMSDQVLKRAGELRKR